MWIGDTSAKGYIQETFIGIFRRYITKADLELLADVPPAQRRWQPRSRRVALRCRVESEVALLALRAALKSGACLGHSNELYTLPRGRNLRLPDAS